jgi:hypothetical protein
MRKIIRALPIFSIAVILAVPSITAQQSSIPSQQPSGLQQERQVVLPAPPSWVGTPTDESLAQPFTVQEKQLRQARSNSFNTKLGFAPRLEDVAQTGGGIGAATDHGFVPPLPVDAPSIVVGKVLSAQSHLSSDHTSIYTELKVQLEKVLKDNSTRLSAGGSLDILEPGGSVILNGQTLRYPVSTSTAVIDIGKRYVLFLHNKPANLNAFGITRAWMLNENHPQPTRAYRLNDQENVGRYTSMTEPEFISYIEHAIEIHSTD